MQDTGGEADIFWHRRLRRTRPGFAVTAVSPLSLHTRVVQAPGVLAAPGEDELLLIREALNDCFALQGSGVAIWEAAARPVCVGEICDALLLLYAVDRGACESQVLSTVEALLDQGLFACVP
ncbi:PqqD family peptide modification chaperone [Sphingomonas sp.]|jgi:hypothetical protein|uniref:PqqD family peptide modification chaperone n=1 Tax=Sphingomonas sp. TaxID=28214 RepID=UPI002E32F501|nr:PqqD family peptide modification chaperone [Sphingomonas sp.]HEX4695228.1 PqqD family peptide modification chaperone [Sphingomonas sp.]